jgi:P pilus assembly chaperone PapD
MAQAPSGGASGIQPELSVLLISEDEGQAQMGLKNLDATPLLLHTRIVDVPEDKHQVVIPLPPVIRMEPKSRQIVRFVLEKAAEPMTVQHYKRVTFEGIPAISKNKGTAVVRVNVRYDLPVIISPKGLVQVENPWEQLQWKLEGRTLTVHNPSPFVVRMSREVDLMPQAKRVEALQRTFVLPGDTMRTELPTDVVPEKLTAVRSFPASLYGAAVAPYEAVLANPSIR